MPDDQVKPLSGNESNGGDSFEDTVAEYNTDNDNRVDMSEFRTVINDLATSGLTIGQVRL
jgi:hypothetical protein